MNDIERRLARLERLLLERSAETSADEEKSIWAMKLECAAEDPKPTPPERPRRSLVDAFRGSPHTVFASAIPPCGPGAHCELVPDGCWAVGWDWSKRINGCPTTILKQELEKREPILHSSRLKRDKDGNDYPGVACGAADESPTGGEVTCASCLREDVRHLYETLRTYRDAIREGGAPFGVDMLPWLKERLKAQAPNSPAYPLQHATAETLIDLISSCRWNEAVDFVKQLAGINPSTKKCTCSNGCKSATCDKL